ncbi:hypothetical protein DTO027B5_8929 [Paecilomyces variotii]|nr:hypothetical protein DTO217A2_7114 [Paecilomyces variotii]KAJ9320016.1 hypothetical protein DTO027B3_8976 [Paecilomyces variotii]KAJ9327677.1 hypothetical protein DTO027B5_8929 [Paecilomyces variotii]KAJ9376029.1 hypothetical protein DTO063F5_9030 [Paecilomyces variotii]
MGSTGNDRFNEEAATWDSDPTVNKASEEAFKAIVDTFPQLRQNGEKTIDVLEIGCGTGLLSLRIAPLVRSLVAVDAAPGMIAALESKLRDPSAPKNITPLALLLTDPSDRNLPPQSSSNPEGPRRQFHLILSHLVLHHIPDLRETLQTMYDCLLPEGSVALTDFEDFGPEARRFHPESKVEGVERHGIHAESFAQLMREVGFVDVDVRPKWKVIKDVERFPGEWGSKKPSGEGVTLEKMEFPFLLCRGKKA